MVRSSGMRMVAVMALAGALFAGGCGGTPAADPATPEAPVTSPTEAPATDTGGDAEFVQNKCTMCHTYDRVEAADYDEAGWTTVVTRMQQNGLVITDEEKAQIIAFLAAQ